MVLVLKGCIKSAGASSLPPGCCAALRRCLSPQPHPTGCRAVTAAVQVVYCCRHEYCETPEDFISRRCRLAFLDTQACREALPRVRWPLFCVLVGSNMEICWAAALGGRLPSCMRLRLLVPYFNPTWPARIC